MAASVHCSIVSAEQEIFSGLVEMVVATGTMGELLGRWASLGYCLVTRLC